MRAPEARWERRGLALRTLIALSAFLALVSLGTWQVERKAWKEALIASLSERLAGEPTPLPAPATWPRLDPAQFEFRRVAFTAEFLHDQEGLVYTTGSALRGGASGPGYWVFTPARLIGGELVMVNRGFVLEAMQNPTARPQGQISGMIDMAGALRWPKARSIFTPSDDPGRNIWFARDPLAIAAAKGLKVAPFYIEMEGPAPPGRVPRVGRLQSNLPNNHLQYALTWYALALALAAVFAAWLFGRREGAANSCPGCGAAHSGAPLIRDRHNL